MRKHWREGDYWWWLWRERVATEVKVVLGVVAIAALLGGGWLAADRLTSAKAVTGTNDLLIEKTVREVVTVRERGKVIKKVVPVVKRVIVRTKTANEGKTQTELRYATRVITTPGATRAVRQVVTTRVPVIEKQVVTVNGKPRTIVRTRVVPTTRTQTLTQAQTQTRTLTNQQTVVNTREVTAPPVTVEKTKTKTETQTQTVTQTQTQTQTVTQTETVTVTQTVTGPGTTVTVTVTTTVPGGP